MSGVYVPGAFCKKKEEDPVKKIIKEEAHQPLQQSLQKEQQRAPKLAKPTIVEIKPVEVKQAVWGGKKNFAEFLKNAEEDGKKEVDEDNEKKKGMKPLLGQPIVQKEIKKEDLDFFMQKYEGKLRKLYEKSIYYDKEFFDKLRINGEQGYITFCKFMFYVI
jgi:hypothetical protein